MYLTSFQIVQKKNKCVGRWQGREGGNGEKRERGREREYDVECAGIQAGGGRKRQQMHTTPKINETKC